ncbi:hypothetical protein ACFLS0_00210 [Candidatus Bipolaricaulota bacterium]
MMKGIVASVFIALVTLLVVAGLGFASPLEEILSIAPLELVEPMIQFTDWSKIKSQLGLGFVTSASPVEFRFELARRISQDQAAASAYGLSHLRSHAEEWGWDTADLDWEANISSLNLAPTYILKFRDGFDFTPLIGRFLERGFIQTESYGATIFSHELDVGADWTRTTELSILTTAYLPEANMLILSSYQRSVDVFLAVAAGVLEPLSEGAFARVSVTHLGDPYAAILLLGAGECLGFTPNPILDLLEGVPMETVIAEFKAKLEKQEVMLPFRALAVAYEYKDRLPIGTIVFEYDTPELAAMDLPLRRALAEEGTSTYYDAPIDDSYFVVLEAEVRESAAILTVAPINDQPWRLFRMIYYRDAVFAGCS